MSRVRTSVASTGPPWVMTNWGMKTWSPVIRPMTVVKRIVGCNKGRVMYRKTYRLRSVDPGCFMEVGGNVLQAGQEGHHEEAELLQRS